MATRGTAAYLRAHGIDAQIVFKINEGRPHVGDELLNRRIALVINTPLGRESFFDDRTVRSVAMLQGVPAITTLDRCGRGGERHRGHSTRRPERQVAAGIPRGDGTVVRLEATRLRRPALQSLRLLRR